MVGCSVHPAGGVIPYNFGKVIQDEEFEQTGFLNSPPTVLLTALSNDHERKGSWSIKIFRLRGKNQYSGAEHDRLYYTQRGGDHDEEFPVRCD